MASGGTRGKSSTVSSTRRSVDVEIPCNAFPPGCKYRQPCISSIFSDPDADEILRSGLAHEDDRPNNWQDRSAWTESPMRKTIGSDGQQHKPTSKVSSDNYEKWARNTDRHIARDKSKANNVFGSSLKCQPSGVQPRTMTLACQQQQQQPQHKPTMKAAEARMSKVRCDDSLAATQVAGLDSESKVTRTVSDMSHIWSELSDLLPPSDVSIDKMDSAEIVSHVMRIRNSLKDASSIMKSLVKMPDCETARLQREYLDTILEILRKQEMCYMVALQRSLVAHDHEDFASCDATGHMSPKSESKSDDLNELDMSDISNDELENPSSGAAGDAEFPLNNQRPIIEDHLGRYSDADLDEIQMKLSSLEQGLGLEDLVMSSLASSHLLPSRPSLNDRACAKQKFRHPDPNSRPGKAVPHGSGSEGRVRGGTKNPLPCAVLREDVKGRSLSDISKNDGDMVSSKLNQEAIDDLAQLMSKKQELESFLALRNTQLKELQQEHDLLKEMLHEQEENASQLQLQGIPSDNDASLRNGRRPEQRSSAVNMEKEQLGLRKFRHQAKSLPFPVSAAAETKASHGDGRSAKYASHQKNLLAHADARGKRDSGGKDSVKLKDSRTPEKDRSPATHFGSLKNRQARRSDDHRPSATVLFDTFENGKGCDAIKTGDDAEDGHQNSLKRKHHHKSHQYMEDDLTASIDAEDPDSSLALSHEVRDSSEAYREECLTELQNALTTYRGCSGNIENDPQMPQGSSENTASKLQENMNQLLEAKKELKNLRKLLHSGVQTMTEVSGSSCESDNRKERSLLKLASSKLCHLKEVMEEISRSSQTISSLTGEGSSSSASNTAKVSNATNTTGRRMQASAVSVEQSPLTLDDQATTDLSHFMQQNLSDEKSFLNDTSSATSTGIRQSAIKDGFFIRNSLPESISSRTTSLEPNCSQNSRGPRDKSVTSKNSSGTNVSSISCIPCVSKSSSVCVVPGCHGKCSTGALEEKNSRKPYGAIRNQHENYQNYSTSFMAARDPRTNIESENNRSLTNGTNLKKKTVAVNTERLKRSPADEKELTELKTIHQELKNLRCEVTSLAQIINSSLSSERPSTEPRGDRLDPQLLIGLNQSFQLLMADNRRLSDRFSKLRDFVLSQMTRNPNQFQARVNVFDDTETSNNYEYRYDDTHRLQQNRNKAWEKRGSHPPASARGNAGAGSKPGRFLNPLAKHRPSDTTSGETFVADGSPCEFVSPNRNRNNSKSDVSLKKKDSGLHSSADNQKYESLKVKNSEFQASASSLRVSAAPRSNGENSKTTALDESPVIINKEFDSMKEAVYSEVVTFISKHEDRPHYLIELIKELQKLKTSQLRRQAVDVFRQVAYDFLPDDQPQVLQVLPANVVAKTRSLDEKNMLACGNRSDDRSSTSMDGSAYNEESEESETDLECDSCYSETVDMQEMELKAVEDMEGSVDRESHSSGGSNFDYSTDDVVEKQWMEKLEDFKDRRLSFTDSTDDVVEKQWMEKLEDFKDRHCFSFTDSTSYVSDSESSHTSSSSSQVETEDAFIPFEPSVSPTPVAAVSESAVQAPADTAPGEMMPAETASSETAPAETAPVAANIGEPKNLDTLAEQMGFVTVEFVPNPSSSGVVRVQLEDGKESDESWEKTELPEKDPESPSIESESSEEISEEILVEDCSSESIEELTLDQLRQTLSSISKDCSSEGIEELTVDQLRQTLTTISKEDIMRRMDSECQGNLSVEQVTETIDQSLQCELAGDVTAVRQPAMSSPDEDESSI